MVERSRNCIITITGQKGSGKSSLAKHLGKRSPRIIIIDRMAEYDGVTYSQPGPCVDAIASGWFQPSMRIVARFRSDTAHATLFAFIRECADRCPGPPLSVVVEEADFFATPMAINQDLYDLVAYGRHWSINLIFVVRGDTDTHRIIRNCSDGIIAMRQYRLSADMRERFTATEVQQIIGLTTYTPDSEPVLGTHYLTFPAQFDVVAEWAKAQPVAVERKKDSLLW